MTDPLADKSPPSSVTRRGFVKSATAAAATVGGAVACLSSPTASAQAEPAALDARQGRLKQSVCRWCFSGTPLDHLARDVAAIGLVGIDILHPNDFETVKRHGLKCTMVLSHSLTDGLCDPQFHDGCLQQLHEAVEATAKEGWPNVICFSGNARGIDRRTGLKNCAEALKKVIPTAEQKKVTLHMEILNSRVDHRDYMCDRSDWGIELVNEVGSDNFKLLYDIYHVQIMEGDIIRSIQDNHRYFGHYHTAGNPGRHELDDAQELFYPAIARAIADTGFDGYFAHEFIPVRDPLTSLREAVQCCIV